MKTPHPKKIPYMYLWQSTIRSQNYVRSDQISYRYYNIVLLCNLLRTLPEPNLSIVSTQPAAAPGTVTLWACLGGRGFDAEKPCDSRTSSDRSRGALPLKEKRINIPRVGCLVKSKPQFLSPILPSAPLRIHMLQLFPSFTSIYGGTLKAGNRRLLTARVGDHSYNYALLKLNIY